MADAKMLNKAKFLAKLRRLPEALKQDIGTQLATEIEDLTEAMKRAAPVSDVETEAGQFRESIHFYPTPDRALSYRIIADAKDSKGAFIGSHIEHGHEAADGSQVPAKPSFFPTYRARKKGIRRRLATATRKSLKAQFPA